MSKERAKTAKQIVESAMPNYRVVDLDAGADASASTFADAAGLDLSDLKKKYGAHFSSEESTKTTDSANTDQEDDDDTEIVLVEPKDDDARIRGDWPKAIVVSKGQQKIVGRQG